MSSKEIVKLLRRCMFSDTLLKMAADKIEELESEINRKQSEIERLKEQIAEVNKTIKSEAVKEFFDRLKEVSSEMVMMCDNGTPISISYSISSKKLDSILKEMVGEEE